MLQQPLPNLNERVDVWFDGYDEFYGGQVQSITRPYKFHVILDDDSSWHLDTRKHIFRVSKKANQTNDNPESTSSSKSAPTTPPRRSSTTNARKSIGSGPSKTLAGASNSSPQAQGANRRTRGRRASAPAPGIVNLDDSNDDAQPSAAEKEKEKESTARRRTSGRALRKNTAPRPPPRTIEDKGTNILGATNSSNPADKSNLSVAAAALAVDAADERNWEATQDDQLTGIATPTQNGETVSSSPSATPSVSSASPHSSPAKGPSRVSRRVSARNAQQSPDQDQQLHSPQGKRLSPRRQQLSQAPSPQGLPSPVENEAPVPGGEDNATQSLPKNRSSPEKSAAVEADDTQDGALGNVAGGRKRAAPSLSDSASDDDGSRSGRLRSAKKRRVGEVTSDAGNLGTEKTPPSSPTQSPITVPSPSRRRASVTFRDEVEVFTAPRYDVGRQGGERGAVRKGVVADVDDSESELAGADGNIGGNIPLTIGVDKGNANTVSAVDAKVITAVAVKAALEAAQTVVEPLNNRIDNMLKELEAVSRDLASQKKQLDNDISSTVEALNSLANTQGATAAQIQTPPAKPPPAQPPSQAAQNEGASGKDKGKRVGISQAVTISALQNFQLDISEIIGGGEARLRMHASLSKQEFDSLHRLISHQGKSLAELDRLLYAAEKFADKASSANGNGNGNGEGAENAKAPEKRKEVVVEPDKPTEPSK